MGLSCGWFQAGYLMLGLGRCKTSGAIHPSAPRLFRAVSHATFRKPCKPRNDTTIRGADFARAIRRILPRQRAGQLGYVVISPGEKPATLRLEGYYAASEVAAEGAWSDAIQVNARQLRGFALGKPPATFHLVFFGGSLVINGATVGASLAGGGALSVPPSYVPTNRLGSPMGRGWKPSKR